MKILSAIFFLYLFFRKVEACKNGKIDDGGKCQCNPGWYNSKESNLCDVPLSTLLYWPYHISKWVIFSYYCFLILFSIFVLTKLVITKVKKSSSPVSNINFAFYIKICWVVCILLVSICASVFMYDPIGQINSYGFTQIFFVLFIIFNHFVASVMFWHWSNLYTLNQDNITHSNSDINSSSHRRRFYSRNQRQSINEFTKTGSGKNKLRMLLRGIFIGNFLSVLLFIAGIIIWNTLGPIHHTDAFSFFCCGYFLFIFIVIHGNFIMHTPQLVKTIPIKNNEKYKLEKASNNIGIMGIIFIITWIISSLVYYTTTIDPVNAIIFYWFVNIPVSICLLFQLLLFFKKSNHFPFIDWKLGRTFSPELKNMSK